MKVSTPVIDLADYRYARTVEEKFGPGEKLTVEPVSTRKAELRYAVVSLVIIAVASMLVACFHK